MFRHPYLNFRILHSFLCFGHNLEAEPTREAYETEDSQRVVVEGFERWEWSTDQFVFHVLEATARQVLDLLGMEVVEKGIDGAITAESILHGGSEFLYRYNISPAILFPKCREPKIPSSGSDYPFHKSRSVD